MKRITAFLMVLVLVLCIMPSGVFAVSTNAVTFTITPDKTEVNPGDTVNFTLSVQQAGQMTALETYLVLPAGLTLVPGSLVTADKSVLGWDDLDKTEDYLQITGFGAPYNGTETVQIATFSCTVDANTSGVLTVSLDPSTYAVDESYATLKEVAIVPAQLTVVIPVTGVQLNKNALSLKTGESETLVATVDPSNASNGKVTWKSDDESIATVDNNGNVTAVNEGTTTITVTTEDGGFKATCTVSVACNHANKTSVAEKASDCKNQGWDAYVKCDDCGQLFAENGTTEINEIPFRPLSQQHTGGTATCTAQAVCAVCGNSYGNSLDHSYTAETKKAEALKTAGNCRDNAVYYYSCSACGKVENNDSHTFEGNKIATSHVGGTALVNQAEANHKTQTDGYTGDTKCLGCGEIIGYGENIPAGSHTPANVWSNDGEYHWKECTVVGCGIVIDGSKAAHSSTGDNVATCQTKAVCDVCNVSYGNFADHDWNTSSWEKDASGHWHKCNTAGCTEKNDFAGHTPDHQGGATEEYAIKCSVCGYIIEAQLNHTHVFDKEVVEEQYLASKANCTEPAKYYKSCKCGEKGTEAFASGEALGHTEGAAWEKDATHHWHICTVAGCGVIIETSRATHTPDHDGGATEEYAIKCSVCGYIIEAQLNHTHVFDKEVAEEQYLASKANCTDPAKYYKSCKCGEKGAETFTFGEALGHTEGTEWKSDADNHWHECSVAGCGVIIDNSKAAHTPDRDAATENDPIKCSVCGYVITPAFGHTHTHGTEWKSDKDNHWNECACGDKANTATHSDANKDGKCDVCEYEVGIVTPDPDNKPEDTNKPSDDVHSPQTGDNSMMWLWMTLLIVSGFGIIATVVMRKKFVR